MRNFNPEYLNSHLFYGTLNPTIQIKFPTAWPSYYTGFSDVTVGLSRANGFAALSEDQQAGIRTALKMWSNYVSVTFTDAATADGKKVSFGFTKLDQDVLGVGYYPQWSAAAVRGDVFFKSALAAEFFKATSGTTIADLKGRANFGLALHEIGHAIGLDHAGGSAKTNGTPLPAGERNILFSVMAYDQYPSDTTRYAITPMLYDIAQLQKQYGANTSYHSGDTPYEFTDATTPFAAEGIAARPDQALMTLWDGGGTDTIDTSRMVAINAQKVVKGVKIDLRQGEFSAIGTDYHVLSGDSEKSNPAFNVGIAFNTVIENAVSGKGRDTLIGNDADNQLDGGEGDDRLEGGLGNDTYVFNGNFGHDTVIDSDGNGVLRFDDVDLQVSALRRYNTDREWTFGQFRFVKVQTNAGTDDLRIEKFDENKKLQGSVLVKNFTSGSLGITLSNTQETPPNVPVLYGGVVVRPPKADDPFRPDTTATPIYESTVPVYDGSAGTQPVWVYGEASRWEKDADPKNVGAQYVLTGSGDDRIAVGRDYSYVSTIGHSDIWRPGEDEDVVSAGAGNDLVYTGFGSDVINGGDGNDSLFSAAVGDPSGYVLPGNSQSLGLTVGLQMKNPIDAVSSDFLDGGAGNDYMVAGLGADTLLGGDGNDTIFGMEGDDFLAGEAGNDYLYGDALYTSDLNLAQYTWSPAAIYGYTTSGNDELSGGAGDDVLVGGVGNDTLEGGTGNDKLWGDSNGANVAGNLLWIPGEYHGADYLDGGDGDDTLLGGGGADTLMGGNGRDILMGDVYVDGSMAIDVAYQGADYLDGGDDDDVLYGDGGNDQLYGGAGNDQLYGGDGEDVLVGGAGSDWLRGGKGNDTYLLAGGDPTDNSVDTIEDTQGRNIVDLSGIFIGGAGSSGPIAASAASDDDLLAGLTVTLGAGTSVTLGYEGGGVTITDFQGVESLSRGEQVVDFQGLVSDKVQTVVTRSTTDDDQRLTGGTQGDALTVQHANAVVLGGKGNDVVRLESQGATLRMRKGDGLDTVRGISSLNTVAPAETRREQTSELPDAASNVVEFAEDIARSDVSVTVDADGTVVVNVAGGGVGLRIESGEIGELRFADGESSVNLLATVQGYIDSQKTEGADHINGSVFSDTVDGGAGDDVLSGYDGNDVLHGGMGNDILLGGMGNDVLDGQGGVDNLLGDEGNDTLISDGDDHMNGGAGDDVYRITLQPLQGNTVGMNVPMTRIDDEAGTNTLSIEGGPQDLAQYTVFRQASQLYLAVGRLGLVALGSNIDLTQFSVQNAAGERRTLAAMVVAQGGQVGNVRAGTWSPTTGVSWATSTDPLNLTGGAGDDVLEGGAGDDTLSGLAGDDTLIGHEGNDLLEGGIGSNTYVFGANDGIDVIKSTPGENGVLRFDGVSADAITGRRSGNDVVLQVGQTGNGTQVLVTGVLADASQLPHWQVQVGSQTIALSDLLIGDASFSSASLAQRRSMFMAQQAAQLRNDGQYYNGTAKGAVAQNVTLQTHVMEGTGGEFAYTPYLTRGATTTSDTVTQARVIGTAGDDIVLPAVVNTGYPNLFRGAIETGDGNDVIELVNGFVAGGTWDRTRDFGVASPGSLASPPNSQFFDHGLGSWIDAGDGDDSVVGSDGNDVIIGGRGSDWLEGQAGADTYLISANGLDADRILDLAEYDWGSFSSGDGLIFEIYGGNLDHPNQDVVEFDSSVAKESLSYRWHTSGTAAAYKTLELNQNGHFFLSIDYSTREHLPTDRNAPSDRKVSVAGVELFRFADGQTLTVDSLLASLPHLPDVDSYGGNPYGNPYGGGTTFTFGSDITPSDLYYQWVEGSGSDPARLQFFHAGELLVEFDYDHSVSASNRTVSLNGVNQFKFDGGAALTLPTLLGGLVQLPVAPVLRQPQVDLTVQEDSDLALPISSASFFDPRGGALSWRASLEDGSPLPAWLHFDAQTRLFTGIPGNAQVGQLSVRVTVTNDAGQSSNDVWQLTVQNVNDAPTVAAELQAQRAAEGTAWQYTIPAGTFADVDVGDLLRYSATLQDGSALPGWLSFNTVTRTFSGTPPSASAGNLSLKVTATDTAGAHVSSSFGLTIQDPNGPVIGPWQPPVFSPTLTLSSDIDRVKLSYRWNESAGGGIAKLDLYQQGQLVQEIDFDSSIPANQRSASLAGVVRLKFADGSILSLDQLETQLPMAATVQAVSGGDFGDTLDLSGTVSANILRINGGDGGDVLTGSSGNDVIVGGKGLDTMKGGGGNDTFLILGTDGAHDNVEGGDGVDRILGGDGDDTIRFFQYTGAQTVEIIDGGLGTNVIAGTSMSDVIDLSGTVLINISHIEGGDGNDTLIGSAGNDFIVGGVGLDTMKGGAGDDTFVITGTDSAHDYVEGGDGVDRILGGNGDDTIRLYQYQGTQTVEIIDGGAGTNVIAAATWGNSTIDLSGTTLLNIARIEGGEGYDTLIGSAGNDVIVGGKGLDTMKGGAGDDTFVVTGTDTAHDYIEGGDGTDRILGGNGDDTIRLYQYVGTQTVEIIDGGAGTNVIAAATLGNSTIDLSGTTLFNIARIEGGDGYDTLIGSAGNDVIVGGKGQDTLKGSAGDDTFVITGTDSALDYVEGGDGIDRILGGDGDDTVRLYQYAGTQTVEIIDGGLGMNIVAGTDMNDTIDLSGTTLINISRIEGGDGYDALIGSAGNDTIVGGHGHDTLKGGAGNDTYRFARGDGDDVVDDNDATVGKSDTLQFESGIAADQLWFRKVGDGLEVSIIGTDDKVLVANWYLGSQYHIEQFKTSDGKVLLDGDVNTLVQAMAAFSPPSAGQTTLPANYASALSASIGASWRNSGVPSTNEAPTAGSLSQSLTEDGTATFALVGSDANHDALSYSILSGPAHGATTLSADGTVTYTPTANYNGADSFTYKVNDGSLDSNVATVTLNVSPANDAPTVLVAPTNQSGTANQAFSYTVPSGTFADVDAGDTLSYGATLQDGSALPSWLSFDAATRTFSGTPPSSAVTSAGGLGVLVKATDAAGAFATASFAVNIASGTLNYISSSPWDDNLVGTAGDDVFLFGGNNGGYDSVQGGDGYDVIQGGSGDDTITMNYFVPLHSVEKIDGGAGVNVLAGAWNWDTLDFSNTELVNIARIDGGGGNDTIIGSAGNDVIVGGPGSDTLRGESGDDVFLFEGDTADVYGFRDEVFGGDGYDVIRGGSGDDIISIGKFDATNSVEKIDGGAGINVWNSGWDWDTLDFSGTELVNIARIDGGGGNDTIIGSAGNDVIAGSVGWDTLRGGAGDDVFLFEGDTADVYSFRDDVFGGDGYDVIRGSNGDDIISIGKFDATNSVEKIDGGAGVNVISGSWNWWEPMDFSSTQLVNIARIEGKNGGDTITGSAGNDTIVGRGGADTIRGGGGSDTFVLGRGDGADWLEDNDATPGDKDTLLFGADITADQLWFQRVGDNLEVSIIGSGDKVQVHNWYLGSQYHIEQFKTSDGKTLLDSDVNVLVQAMASFSPPAAGQTTLPANYHTSLDATIAANWQ